MGGFLGVLRGAASTGAVAVAVAVLLAVEWRHLWTPGCQHVCRRLGGLVAHVRPSGRVGRELTLIGRRYLMTDVR